MEMAQVWSQVWLRTGILRPQRCVTACYSALQVIFMFVMLR